MTANSAAVHGVPRRGRGIEDDRATTATTPFTKETALQKIQRA
jgi:hypothetical protein